MADIDILCAGCGKTSTLSEFADISLIKCQYCGGALNSSSKVVEAATPVAISNPAISAARAENIDTSVQAKTDEKKKLSLKKYTEDTDDSSITAQNQKPSQWNQISEAKTEVANRQEKHFNHSLASSLIFVVLAGLCGGMRYGGFMPDIIGLIKIYGPWIVIIMHVTIVLKAFKDNMFTGVMCTIIPGYSFYYLFFAGDDFYTRAVFGGILVGIGYDSGLIMNDWAQEGIAYITDLIAQK